MKIPCDTKSRVALAVVGILLLGQIALLISQLFFGNRLNISHPSSLLSAILTVFLSVVSLILFFAWKEHSRFLLLALFFFWLSFAIKNIAIFQNVGREFAFEISVTAIRIAMSVSLVIGILQGEWSNLVAQRRQ